MKLKQLKLSSGGTPSTACPEFYSNQPTEFCHPWVISGDLGKTIYLNPEASARYVTAEGAKSASLKIKPAGSVLIAMYGSPSTIGKTSILKSPAYVNQAVAVIHPSTSYLPEYLYFWLLSQRQLLIQEARGSCQINISLTTLKNLQLPIIDLTDQQKVVNRLSQQVTETQSLIDNLEKQIKSFKALKKAFIQDAFKKC